MDPRLATDMIRMVDERFAQLVKTLPRTAYGVISAVDEANHKVSVLVSGEAIASGGFSYPAHWTPIAGVPVRVVIDPRGDRYVDEFLPFDLTTSTSGNPAATILPADSRVPGDEVTMYPIGLSFMSVSTAVGWPTATGMVVTMRVNTARIFQWWLTASSTIWYRSGHSSSYGVNEFDVFHRLDDRVRFVGDSASTIVENQSTAVAIAHTTTSADAPSGSVAAQLGIIFDGNDTDNDGNLVTLYHGITTNDEAVRCYSPFGKRNFQEGTVALSSGNFGYTVSRAAGTLNFWIRRYGYWIIE